MRKNVVALCSAGIVVLAVVIFFLVKSELKKKPIKIPEIEWSSKSAKDGSARTPVGGGGVESEKEKKKLKALAISEDEEFGEELTEDEIALINHVREQIKLDIHPEKKVELLDELWGIEHPLLVEIAMIALSDENAEVRLSAIELIEDYETDKALPAIEKALQDNSLEVREVAVNSLYYIETPDATNLLVKGVDDKAPEIRELVFDILEDRPQNVQESVLQTAIKSPQKDVKERVADMIIDIPSHNVMDILLEGMKTRDEEFRQEIVEIIDFFVSEEFESYEEAKRWWETNKYRFDEELFERD